MNDITLILGYKYTFNYHLSMESFYLFTVDVHESRYRDYNLHDLTSTWSYQVKV